MFCFCGNVLVGFFVLLLLQLVYPKAGFCTTIGDCIDLCTTLLKPEAVCSARDHISCTLDAVELWIQPHFSCGLIYEIPLCRTRPRRLGCFPVLAVQVPNCFQLKFALCDKLLFGQSFRIAPRTSKNKDVPQRIDFCSTCTAEGRQVLAPSLNEVR